MPHLVSAKSAPKYFESPGQWRAWLEKHHSLESELLVEFHKVGSGQPSMTWPESVDEALCFGWIDGVRRSVDAERYTIRFSVRKPRSIWSRINIAKAEALIASGRMRPAGLAAFSRRTEERSGVYSFERAEAHFDEEARARFEANAEAWTFFQAQAPSYRRTATWWVVSAKQTATRERRLAKLIGHSAKRTRLF